MWHSSYMQTNSPSVTRTPQQWRWTHLLSIILVSSLLLLSTAPQRCAAAQESSLQETVVDTSTTASVPATGNAPFANAKQLVLVLPLAPISQPPAPPPAYQNYPYNQWDSLGGGYFLITKNDFGIFGVLTEAWYLPGLYHPKCSGRSDVYYSAQRLWTNMEVSRIIGRKVWGFPKESASVQWGSNSVLIKDTYGNIIFSASFSDPLDKPSPSWLTSFADTGVDTIQWPIHDIAVTDSSSTEAQNKGSQQSRADEYIAAHILPTTLASEVDTVSTKSAAPVDVLVPNVQHLSFTGSTPGTLIPAPGYSQLKVVSPTQIVFDSKAFTGRIGQEVVLADGLDVGIIVGTPGSLNNPVQYNC